MKKKPKVLNLLDFINKGFLTDFVPFIVPICNRLENIDQKNEWYTYWKRINTANKIVMTNYFQDDFYKGKTFEDTVPYVYLLRVMVLHDFCELYGYKLKDIKYAKTKRFHE